jgi:Domain of unknown function (DUF4249)
MMSFRVLSFAAAPLYRSAICWLLALLLIFLTACETVVDLDIPPATPLLIVEGGIERHPGPDSATQRIRLTTTVPYVGPAAVPPPVATATVRVMDGASEYVFVHEGAGYYVCRTLAGSVGHTYALRIDYNGATYVAEETLLAVAPLDRLYTAYEEATAVQPAGLYVKFDTRDPAPERNYYRWRFFINGKLQLVPDPGNTTEVIATDEFFNGQPLMGLRPSGDITVAPGDSVLVEQLGISQRQYEYLYGVFVLTGAGGPLFGDPPPANIPGNLRNLRAGGPAALGYFGASTVSALALVVQ